VTAPIRTVTFHKVPGTGAYGLRSWYPNAKAPKAQGTGGGAAEADPEGIDSASEKPTDAPLEETAEASAA
jgi:hypothetical protein